MRTFVKKIIRCKKCSNRIVIRNAGFLGNVEHHCKFLRCEIDLDDGCTFGEEGSPITGSSAPDVYLTSDTTCDKGYCFR